MYTIDLAYVGKGLHEELVAYIADQQGFYADEGVHVALHDACTWDIERLRHVATIGLGRSLQSRLTDGIPWVTVHVNTHRPLFWIIGRSDLTSLADLAGRRLAVHPAHSAPGCFARIVLRNAGLDPDRDIRNIYRPPGDYGMDLRQMQAGRIDAAMVSDTLAPDAIAAEYGWHVLGWIGGEFQIPTVGIAVDTTYIKTDDPALQAVVRAHRRALQVIHDDPDTAVQHIESFFGRHTAEEAQAHYETYIAPHFTTDGQADLALATTAINALADELGVPVKITADEFYRTGTTAP
jgi:ABC-type nitrate/sulfonate/bicarbonate transport system substrate-binding protein